MTTKQTDRHSSHPIFEAIAAASRREILRLLLDRDIPVTEYELASHLRTTEYGLTEQEQTTETIHATLTHIHLPKLVAANLITRNRNDGTVDVTAHPAITDPRFRALLEVEADGLDETLLNLANDHRRVILTILREAQESMTRRDIARELLRSANTEIQPDRDVLDDAIVTLHHIHLPALVDAGLVEFNPQTNRAAYTGHPAVEEIFTILYEPRESLVDSYDGFFKGLGAASEKLGSESSVEVGWPHFWRDAI